MNNWIFVESLFNWENDFQNKFEFLGMRLDVFKNKKFENNDKIFTYITKQKKFSDIRKITSNEIFDLPNTYKYDKEFTKAIKTKPVKILNQEDWLDFDNIKNELEVFALAKSSGLRLLNAPLKLNEFDTKKLESFFNLK